MGGHLPAFLPPTPLRANRARRGLCSARGARAQLAGNIEDMPAELIPSRASELPAHWRRAGVYGVYSSTGALQYVAAVSDVSSAIGGHIRYVERACDRHAVRMLTVDDAGAAPLGQIAESWVLAHSGARGVPPGNGDAAPEWRREAPPTDVVLAPGAGDELLMEEIRRVVREHAVVVFMKGAREAPRCGFSAAVADAVRRVVGDDFVAVDCLDGRNGGVRQAIKEFSGWPTLPQLYVGGEFVGGADIVTEMAGSGDLAPMLEKAVAGS